MTILCTLAEVRAMLHLNASATSDDGLISSVIIPAASQMIENEARLTFGTLQSSLYLDAAHPYLKGNTLYFRDNLVVGVDNFTSDTGTLTSVMYDLLPLNFSPKYAARLRPGYDWGYSVAEKAFTVTGTLGYGTLPADINFAATKLAAWIYNTRDSEGNIQIVENVTEVPAQAPPLVKSILEKYKHDMVFA